MGFCGIYQRPSRLENWGIFDHTLIKAAHLPHEFVGGDAPSLFPLLVLSSASYPTGMDATRGGGQASVGSLSFSFSAARSRLLRPFVTLAPLRATPNCLESFQAQGEVRGRV